MAKAEKLARTVRVFEEPPKWGVRDELADFEGRPSRDLYFSGADGNPDYDALFQHYDIKPSFREKVANLSNPGVLESNVDEPLEINWVTSADILAARAGKIPSDSFFQLAAIGVTITSDNQVLVGFRGRDATPEKVDRFASGLYGCPPGGSVTFKPGYETDPITDTILGEFEEEVGNFRILDQRPIGVFEAFKPGPTGLKFVNYLTTQASLASIQRENIKANRIYNSLRAEGASKEVAKANLGNRGLPRDAWEHFPIIGFPNDPDALEHTVEAQPQAFSGIGAGALLLYAEHLRNRQG
ncbi:hypothetical protein CMI37_26090 [Candidatus Pacearchaeota archaeon]|nr:hypothetical protein [Candidatus Pacearchaeota archaeon]|tara:strand:- start:17573 stop:18466 length:894 start_codon:yes stop_codon:yes gene_type:complete